MPAFITRFCCYLAFLCAARLVPGAPSPLVTNVNSDSLNGPRISAVTYNMLHGFGNRLNDDTLDERLGILAAALRENPPDIVILQEASVTRRHDNVVDRLRDMLNAGLEGAGVSFNSAQLMANGSSLIGFLEGSAILSRFRILSAEALVYKAQALIPPERRIALRVRLLGSRGGITVIGTHLTNTKARSGRELTRTRQAEELAAWMAGVAAGSLTIVGGDFNDVPGSATVGAMLAAGARDAWAEAAESGAARAGEPGPGFTALSGTVRDPGDIAEQRIDYVFVFGGGVAVQGAFPFLKAPGQDASGKSLWASDHTGLRVVLSLP